MNNIFLSYKSSSKYFLEQSNNFEIISGDDYFQSLPNDHLYDYTLFKNSIVTELKVEQGNFRFFELPTYGTGFLTKVGSNIQVSTINVNPLHLELYQYVGSIIDSYSINSRNELLPYNNVFSINENIFGIGDFEIDYIKKCNVSNMSVIQKLFTLTTIANESNGNLVQYDNDSKIYFYLADHIANQKNLVSVQGSPKDTFYNSSKILTLKEWVDFYFDQFIQ